MIIGRVDVDGGELTPTERRWKFNPLANATGHRRAGDHFPIEFLRRRCFDL